MAAAALSFSLMSALVKAAGARLPTMEVVFARSLVVLVLSGWGLYASAHRGHARERGLLFVRGLLGFTALSCYYFALIHLPLADATVIQHTNPVFTALLAAPVLGERLRPLEIVVAMVSLSGVALIARPGFLTGAAGALDPFAVSVALTGALFSAAAYVTVRRLRGEPPLRVVFWFAAVGTCLSLPPTLIGFVPPRGSEWLVLLGVGVTTYLGQVFLTRSLQRERAGRATAVGYLQIVFAAVWGALFFAEVPDGWTAAGAVLIVGSTLLISRPGTPTVAVADQLGRPGDDGG